MYGVESPHQYADFKKYVNIFAEFATLCESLSAIFENIIAFGWAKININ